MDNLTHSLVGIALGRSLDRREGVAAGAAVWTAVIASNAPDIDILLPPILTGGKIEFLVHHRGWTHTLLLVPLLALASAVIALGLRRWRRNEAASPRELWRLSLIAAAGVCLHVTMDFLNSYGVHPFAPFWRGWLYGDSVFIAEPMMWWALLPFVSEQAATRRGRIAWLAIGVLPIGALFFLGSAVAPVLVTAFALLALAAQRVAPGTRAAWTGVIAVPMMFSGASLAARSAASRTILARPGEERLLDLVTTPAPGNPFCWRIESASVDGDDYVAREGTVSLLPGLLAADGCFPRPGEGTTAPLTPSTAPSSARIEWRGEFRRTLLSFRDKAHDCRVEAMLGFMRVPYWTETRRKAIYGDLRYDFGPDESFGEVALDTKKPYCVSSPWIPPRADILYE